MMLWVAGYRKIDLDRLPRGAECARALSQPGSDDPRAHATGPPFKLIQELLQRPEQRCAGAGDSAAKDHDLRIQSINQGSNSRGQSAHRGKPNVTRLDITFLSSGDQSASGG